MTVSRRTIGHVWHSQKLDGPHSLYYTAATASRCENEFERVGEERLLAKAHGCFLHIAENFTKVASDRLNPPPFRAVHFAGLLDFFNAQAFDASLLCSHFIAPKAISAADTAGHRPYLNYAKKGRYENRTRTLDALRKTSPIARAGS